MATEKRSNSGKLSFVNGGGKAPQIETKNSYRLADAKDKSIALRYKKIEAIQTSYGTQEAAIADLYVHDDNNIDGWSFFPDTLVFQRSIKKLMLNNPSSWIVGILTKDDKNWYLEDMPDSEIESLQNVLG